MNRGFESIVRLLHVKCQVSCLVITQLLARLHLVECDQPLNDLSAVLKVLVSHLVDRLYDIREKWVERRLGDHIEPQSVEKGDEVLRGCKNETARRCRDGWRSSRGSSSDDLVCCETNSQSFFCTGTLDLLRSQILENTIGCY